MPANRVYVSPLDMGRVAIQGTYRPDGWGAHWLGRALPALSGGGAADVARVHWWGDSLSVGDDASSLFGQAPAASNSTAQKDAWRQFSSVGVFRDGLQDRYGDAGEGFEPFGLAVTTGTWTLRLGAGMSEARATAAASATWKVRGTSVTIFYRTLGITGSWRYQVDGGGFTTVTTPAGASEPGTVNLTSLSDGEHTIRVEWVSGTVGICGVRGLRDGPGVRVDRFAMHGASASDLSVGPLARRQMSVQSTSGSPNITAGTGGYFTAADVGSRITGTNIGTFGAFIGTVPSATTATLVDSEGTPVNAASTATASCLIDAAPLAGLQGTGTAAAKTIGNVFAAGAGLADLVIVAFGANDAANGTRASETTIRDAIGRLASQYLPADDTNDNSPDFVFVIHHVGKWFNVEQRYPTIAATLRSIAAGLNGAVIDMWTAGRRSYGHAKDEQYWAGAASDNQVHTSRHGQEMLGEAMLALALK